MSTFTAYLDDQDLIRIQKGEEHILPFYLEKIGRASCRERVSSPV